MATRSVNGVKAEQLSFLDQLDKLPIGQLISVPIWDDGIGGELLNILSKGLYTNPLDAIREYAQNSIDAGAKEVTIRITGNTVYVLDDGNGMSREELLQAREFGVSTKSIELYVGFRGIGLYSGFDLCERLIIRTKAAGDNKQHILTLEFKRMREKLDAARMDPTRPRVPLGELLSSHSYYHAESVTVGTEDKAFTIVALEELSDDHIHRLADIKTMRKYVLRNLPIRFSKDFKYAEEIERNLVTHVDGYKSARVILRIGNQEAVVEKPDIPNLDRPHFGHIRSNGRDLAYYWACLTSVSGEIQANDSVGIAPGIAYKVKGFSIGEPDVAREHIGRIPDWWIGEIYVLDTGIIPTSARNAFEAGKASDELFKEVKRLLNGQNNPNSFQKIALKAQAERAANRIFAENKEEIDKIEEKIRTGNFDRFPTFAELEGIHKTLNRHKGKSSDPTNDLLLKRIRSLQSEVQKAIDNSATVSEQKRQAAKKSLKQEAAQPAGSASSDEETTENVFDMKSPDSEESQDPKFIARLTDVIAQTGWTIAQADLELLEIIGDTLADVLGARSEQYIRFMSELSERLTETISEG